MSSVYVITSNGSTKRYAGHQVKETFQLMGCKPLHSFQMAASVSQQLRDYSTSECPVAEARFLQVVETCLREHSYSWRGIMSDFDIARRVMDREQSVCILLGGTSGCGKSTLASLLANKIGLSTVLSTDNVRHLLRNFTTEEANPILWASSYHAGEIYEKKVEGAATTAAAAPAAEEALADPSEAAQEADGAAAGSNIIRGYEAQNDLVYKRLDQLIGAFEARKESLIVEGVHLSVEVILKLMDRHPTCMPFLIYISNEAKHTERFAIRAKYMTLEPRLNKYVKYFTNIRIIQSYLCNGADEHLIPKVDNTNVDRSLVTIHRTVFSCLRRIDKERRLLAHAATFTPNVLQERDSTDKTDQPPDNESEWLWKPSPIYDASVKKARLFHEIFSKIENKSLGSKEMLKRIKQKKQEVLKVPAEHLVEEEHDITFSGENITLWYGSLGS